MRTLVIIVNYYSAVLTSKAVQSVSESGSIGPVEVVVVDNSEDNVESDLLKRMLDATCRIIIPEYNLGFGQACNLAMKETSCEAVLLLNPDARLLPDSLKSMQQALFSLPGAGAVGPQIFWDDELKFYLPPSYPPELFLWQPVIDSWGREGFAYKLIKTAWRRFSIKVWKAQQPVSVPALSGGHILIKSSALQKTGELFDPNFFMYFEDTDLCKRLKKKGYKLYVNPHSQVVHAYGACGGDGSFKRKQVWMKESREKFLNKHTTSGIRILQKTLTRSKAKTMGDQEQTTHVGPFVVDLARFPWDNWLFEWSPNPDFIPSAGCFGSGPSMVFSQKFWDLLRPGRYYGRIGRPTIFSPGFVYFSWIKQ